MKRKGGALKENLDFCHFLLANELVKYRETHKIIILEFFFLWKWNISYIYILISYIALPLLRQETTLALASDKNFNTKTFEREAKRYGKY